MQIMKSFTGQGNVTSHRLIILGIPIKTGSLMPRGLYKTSIIFLLLTCIFIIHPQWAKAAPGDVPIPELATWQSDMLTFGTRQCHYFSEPGWDGGYGDTYYDAARVFYQMNDYTGDPSWKFCARLAAVQYYTTQVTPNGAAGWNNFSPGLRMHFQRTGDPLSKQTVHILATSGFASDSTLTGGYFNSDYGSTYDLAREISYAIKNHLDDEAVGAPHRARLDELVNHAIKHYDQWFVSKQAQTNPIPSQYGPIGIQPFMVGLNMQALIVYYEKYQDPRIPPLIRLATDELYKLAWRPTAGGFYYNSGIGTGADQAEPGLNLLIAPAYAWMYKMTGETMYRDRGDEIFAAGVHYTHCASSPDSTCPGVTKGAYLWYGKQFNQEYAWSFDYVKFRNGPVGSPTPSSVPSPVPVPAPALTQAPPPAPVPTPNPLPMAPSVLLPGSGTSLPSSTTSVTLSFSPVAGATSYAIRVNDLTDSSLRDPRNNCPGNNQYVCIDFIGSTFLSLPVQDGHSYKWWVQTTDGKGHWSFATIAEFSVQATPPSPAPVPTAPPTASSISPPSSPPAAQLTPLAPSPTPAPLPVTPTPSPTPPAPPPISLAPAPTISAAPSGNSANPECSQQQSGPWWKRWSLFLRCR